MQVAGDLEQSACMRADTEPGAGRDRVTRGDTTVNSLCILIQLHPYS